MTRCTTFKTEMSPLKRRTVEVNFDGGKITSDGRSIMLTRIFHEMAILLRNQLFLHWFFRRSVILAVLLTEKKFNVESRGEQEYAKLMKYSG